MFTAGIANKKLDEALIVVANEFKKIKKTLVSSDELTKAKNNIEGSTLLGIETSDALAFELGASWVGRSSESPPEKLHGAIMFAPAGELVPFAMRALAKGGTLAIAGIHMSPIPSLNYDEELFGERVIRSVTANTKQDGLDLLQIAAEIPIRTHTELFRLEDANIALQNLKAGNIQGAGVLDVRSSCQ